MNIRGIFHKETIMHKIQIVIKFCCMHFEHFTYQNNRKFYYIIQFSTRSLTAFVIKPLLKNMMPNKFFIVLKYILKKHLK